MENIEHQKEHKAEGNERRGSPSMDSKTDVLIWGNMQSVEEAPNILNTYMTIQV